MRKEEAMSKVKTFGDVDARSLEQLERCMAAGDAEFGVLCADHHPGYSQPIGGGIAYEGYVSPSGVGFDIGCIASGARITTVDGYTVPIEEASSSNAVACLDKGVFRCVSPHSGAVRRGSQAVQKLFLANGRSVKLTPDHRVLTRMGWLRADALEVGDEVLCQPHVGVRHEPFELDAALIRLLAYASGDGHVSADGKSVSIYTTVPEDAAALTADFAALGYRARTYRRQRHPRRRAEILVKVGSVKLNGLFRELGSPPGRKRWDRSALTWLLDAPAWVRAHFVSAFASAEMTTPRVVGGCLTNHALKQADAQAARLVVELMTSLGFRCSLSLSGSAEVIQVIGGEDEQLRFIEEVGFCRAFEKRLAAARAVSVAWQRRELLQRRSNAQTEVEVLWAAGVPYREILNTVSSRHSVPRGFVHHSLYSSRPLRRGVNAVLEPHTLGEGVWVSVTELASAGIAETWDVVTGDPAESFLAEGIVVHNCGNKAAQTELTRADLEAQGGVEQIMREITRRISFGMGVPAAERVDHPVLERIRNAEFAPQRTLSQLAESQLGTVGSGNHYVNVMEDEEGRIWVGVHFGSRGFGHKTASGFLALAQGLAFNAKAHEGEMDSPPVLFPIDSELGEAYIAAMELAGEYAYAGRDVVVSKVLEILGAEAVHEVHNHHNFAWREKHFGRTYWVVRKGCTPARPGQEGFVGGSMGDESVILEGVESPDATDSLYSTVHGAGRVMSRTQAAGRVRRRKRYACSHRDCDRIFDIDGVSSTAGVPKKGVCPDHPDARVRKVWVEEQVSRGRVDWPAVQARLREQGIVLVGGGADEAPEVYKRLPEVLAAHGDSIRVKHTLRPLGVAMAGREIVDPYKD
jgi:tRNA-splicing ligase RtcB (3'-phosphate/5'-hydroxy nucleic acid ligase)